MNTNVPSKSFCVKKINLFSSHKCSDIFILIYVNVIILLTMFYKSKTAASLPQLAFIVLTLNYIMPSGLFCHAFSRVLGDKI